MLIAYSLKNQGEYFKTLKDIRSMTPIEGVKHGNCLTMLDDLYPKEFFNLRYPPFVLYYKGDLSLLKQEKAAIVGSRSPCQYAIKATKLLSRGLDDRVIVSGLAKGIDAIAHDNAKRTIGILGSGIDYYYPSCNRELIDKVAKDGLVLSEYPGLTLPLAYHFPFRNRLIAALSKTIYVMQAGIKSGTMTTVKEGLEMGRDIRVLPYRLDDEEGLGNNLLISEGASIIDNDEIAFLK